jgi:hypothetical protein
MQMKNDFIPALCRNLVKMKRSLCLIHLTQGHEDGWRSEVRATHLLTSALDGGEW